MTDKTQDRPLLPREKVSEMMADEAFALSVKTRDTQNMQMVLRAYGYQFTTEAAEYAIWFGEQV
jgi:hypothetical protein